MVLELTNLSIEYETEKGQLRAVDTVNLSIKRGETVGIVGESGCGKSTLIRSIPHLLPHNGQIVEGDIVFQDESITDYSNTRMKALRWKKIAYIIQNAMNALDPVYQIGSQFVEVITTHTDLSKHDAQVRAADLMEDVGLSANRLGNYPHELSGGQRQRVVIALALALDPPLILADEPTTGLDVVVQDEILELFARLQAERNHAMVFISHDISAVAEVADRIAVMYGGRIAELGTTREVLKDSGHPYTMGLRNAFPSLNRNPTELVSIPGNPPNLVDPPQGCRFAERCPFSTEKCEKEPPLTSVSSEPESTQAVSTEGSGFSDNSAELPKAASGSTGSSPVTNHVAKCHYTHRAAEFREQSKQATTWRDTHNE